MIHGRPAEHFGFAEIAILVNSIILTLTLVAIAIQSHYAQKNVRVFLLNMRYAKHFELERFLFEHPDLIPSSVRKETAESFEKNGIKSHDQLRNKIYMDMLLDSAEFFFLTAKHEDKKHNERLVRRMMSNPRMKDHWNSPYKGSVRDDFEKFVNGFYDQQDAKK